MRLPRSTWGRLALVLPALAGMVVLLVWRGPDWGLVADAFRLVVWEWVVVAILLVVAAIRVRCPRFPRGRRWLVAPKRIRTSATGTSTQSLWSVRVPSSPSAFRSRPLALLASLIPRHRFA